MTLSIPLPISTDQLIADLEAWASIPGVDRLIESIEGALLAAIADPAADLYDDPVTVDTLHTLVVDEAARQGHPLPSTAPPESCDRCGSTDRTLHLADVRIVFGAWHCVPCSTDVDVASRANLRSDVR